MRLYVAISVQKRLNYLISITYGFYEMTAKVSPTGVERFFDEDEIIVSKTDVKGRITYANDVFLKIAGFSEKEIMNQPHSIIRHPDMPRCVFKLLWDTLASGKEIFAYVVNMSKNGDYYWVFAHVTPTYDSSGNIISYHSSRRVPRRDVVDNVIIPLYKALVEEENRYKSRKDGMDASFKMVLALLEEKGVSYDEFIFSL